MTARRAHDRLDCVVCGRALPSRDEREHHAGRPRQYCPPPPGSPTSRCKERAKWLRGLDRRVAWHVANGRLDVAERVLRAKALRVASFRREGTAN
jgi:hypothetical protein